MNFSADRTLWPPLRGRGLCAGRRLNPLTVFWLVTQSRAPYSPQGRGSAPATSAVTTLHRSIVVRTHIDNILWMDERKRLGPCLFKRKVPGGGFVSESCQVGAG